DDDAAGTVADGQRGVLGREDALEDDGDLRERADPLDAAPGQLRIEDRGVDRPLVGVRDGAGAGEQAFRFSRSSPGGRRKPARTSRFRVPMTGVSTVTSSARQPAASARWTSAFVNPRSGCT